MFQGQFPAITPITLFLGRKSSSLAIWQDSKKKKKCCLHVIACYLSREASKTLAPTALWFATSTHAIQEDMKVSMSLIEKHKSC